MDTYDLVVIGAGTGGLVTSAGAAMVGAKTALIEKDKLGGECLYSGCVPSKALLRTAHLYYQMQHAEKYGLKRPPEIPMDFKEVMDRMRRVIADVGKHDSPERFEALGIKVLKGKAELDSPTRLHVNGDTIGTKKMVLATGSRTFIPPIPGLEEAGYLTHVEGFNLDALPPSVVVLGGGPIGLEFAQVFNRLGSKVTILEVVGHLLPREDPEIAGVLEKQLLDEGIKVHTCTKAFKVDVINGKKVVFGQCEMGENKEEMKFETDAIFIATGRRPNIEEFGLDRAGIRTNRPGIVVDDTLRSNLPNVWAVGDVTGKRLFTHVAEYQGRLVVRNIFFPFSKRADYRLVPWCTFTDPEVARIGMTEDEAKKEYGDTVKVFRYGFDSLDRAIADGEPIGVSKFVCAANGLILGVHIVGPDAGNIIHEAVVAMNKKMKIQELSSIIHIYPTLPEVIRRTADGYYRDKLNSGFAKKMIKIARWFKG